MMPIFFHLEAHLWIFYTLFFNGGLLHLLLCGRSSVYRQLTLPFEAQALAAFFLSVLGNGLLMLLVSSLGLAFDSLVLVLPAVSFILLLLVWLSRARIVVDFADFNTNSMRGVIYLLVFAIAFYNGGLIEVVSDAWWHMSLANKIAMEGSLIPERGHLTGMPTRYYPPLWHANLAMLNNLSAQGLGTLWNAFTAWGAVLKIMAYYLLALGATRKSGLAVLAAFLFLLLPGVGSSYLRVAAWPSHIAYAAFFSIFYLLFRLLDRGHQSPDSPGLAGASMPAAVLVARQSLARLWRYRVELVALLALCVLIFFTHKVELVFLSIAFALYSACAMISMQIRAVADNDFDLVEARWTAILFWMLAAAFSAWLLVDLVNDDNSYPDRLLAAAWVLGMCVILLLLSARIVSGRGWVLLFGIVLLVSLLASLDSRHVLSLLDPELAYPGARYHELPLIATGWLGDSLKMPDWRLQLRSGLLYSGLLSLPLSWLMVYLRQNRASVFCAGLITGTWVLLLSPYLYDWLTHAMKYHSSWRVSILIVHPLLLALLIDYCWQRARQKS